MVIPMIRFRPLWGLTIASLIGIAILCGLGKWQLDRLHWKLGLIAAAETRSHAPPVRRRKPVRPAGEGDRIHACRGAGTFAARQTGLSVFAARGRPHRFRGDRSRCASPMGACCSSIAASSRRSSRPVRSAPTPADWSTVTGLVRAAQKPGLFTPNPDLNNKIWYVRDLGAISGAEGLSDTLPFSWPRIAASTPGYPEGGHTRLTFRNDHFQYALTWFALAVVLLVIYFAYHMKRGRLGFARARQVRGPCNTSAPEAMRRLRASRMSSLPGSPPMAGSMCPRNGPRSRYMSSKI